jgi:hypothetical protein
MSLSTSLPRPVGISYPSRESARDVLLGLAVVLFVLSPELVSHRAFGIDSSNHAWLIWNQGLAIAHTGHPTLFLSAGGPGNTQVGILEPYYGFYGGTLYAFAGTISALLGDRPQAAYIICSGIFVAMAYRGVWLIARAAGVSRLVANLPAFIFATSAYYVTDVFARAAWPELAALSALPFVLGYGLRLLRERWTAGGVAGFAFGTVLLTGSHNISLVWSTTIVLIVGALAYVLVGSHRPSPKRLAMVGALFALSTAVNAWFLLLDLLHSADTFISTSIFYWEFTKGFDKLTNVFTPLRSTPKASGTIGLTIEAPVLALALAIGLLILSRRSTPPDRRFLRRLWWLIVGAIAVLCGLLVMHESAWNWLGHPYTYIQFPYRLVGWITLGVVLLLVLGLGLVRNPAPRTRRWLVGLGGLLVVVTLIQAAVQLYPHNDDVFYNYNRNVAYVSGPQTLPWSWYDDESYHDGSLPEVVVPSGRELTVPIPRAGGTHVHAMVTLPPGTDPVETDFAGGPYVEHVSGDGFKVIGRSDSGMIVIQPTTPGIHQPTLINVDADGGAAQTIGGAISVIALLILIEFVGFLGLRSWRARRSSGPGGGGEPPAADLENAPDARPQEHAPAFAG